MLGKKRKKGCAQARKEGNQREKALKDGGKRRELGRRGNGGEGGKR
jgi:hypothetical protein